MNTNELIAARLKQAREKIGISQRVLAEWCGWTQSRIGNYESGSRSIGADDAAVLAAALKMTPCELMFGDKGEADQLLTDRHRRLIELFNQLPLAEQDNMLRVFELRLKELDEFVEIYVRGRIKDDPR